VKKVLSLALVLTLMNLAVAIAAQQDPAGTQPTQAAALANKDVVEMMKSGLSADIIVAKIKSSPTSFDTSPTALQELKAAGLPDQVIVAMVEASARPASPAAAAAGDGNAVLYFYRIKQFAGSALEPTVYCDNVELARMDNGRYFGVSLTPGKHTCRMGDKQTGFEIDAKPGQEYYAKIGIEAGFWKGHGRLTLVQPEQGAFELKKVKPLGASKVKDKKLVVVYEGSDGQQAATASAAGDKKN
jgi:hypothetical protein